MPIRLNFVAMGAVATLALAACGGSKPNPTDPGYVGWRWAITVVQAPGAEDVTVDEVVLLPGDGALLAPPWVPWQERLRPGDLGVGDILPTTVDDDRLVPSYAEVDDPDTAGVWHLRSVCREPYDCSMSSTR